MGVGVGILKLGYTTSLKCPCSSVDQNKTSKQSRRTSYDDQHLCFIDLETIKWHLFLNSLYGTITVFLFRNLIVDTGLQYFTCTSKSLIMLSWILLHSVRNQPFSTYGMILILTIVIIGIESSLRKYWCCQYYVILEEWTCDDIHESTAINRVTVYYFLGTFVEVGSIDIYNKYVRFTSTTDELDE